MSQQTDRANQLIKLLAADQNAAWLKMLVELLELRQMIHAERCLDMDSPRVAGRGQECRDLRRALLTVDRGDVDYE